MAEGGAGGREVGRISIRVLPNTDRFRADLQRQLDEIEKGTKFKVRIDPDMDGFRDKVDAATRNLKDAKVKVKTEFDHKGDLIHDLDSAMGDASKRAKLDVTPNINQSSFQKALRDVKAQGKLANVKLDVDFQDTQAEVRLAELIGRLKAEAAASDIKVKVKTDDVRRISGERGPLRDLFSGGGGAASGAANGLGGAGLLTSQAGLIGVAIVGLLAPALALLSTALVSLPALVTAVALPIGVFALGIGGIKKALDDSGILKDVQEFGKNGKPKGKDKQSLGAALKELQQQVSDVFEKGFTPLFRQVGAAIPALTRGLPFIAQGIVNLATGVTKALTSTQNIANFDRLTNSVSTMLTNLSPGLTSFANGMSNLITNVGDHLPGLGTVMSGWADRFSNWVTAISKPKQDWFKQDIPNSSTLDSAVSNLKPVLNSVVDFVGQLTAAGLRLAANPDMANNIKTVIDGLTNFITTGLPKLNDVFKGIADTMHMLGIDTSPKPDKNNPAGQPGGGSASAFWGRSVSKPADKPGVGVDPSTKQFTSDLAGLEAEYNAGKGPFGWLHNAIKSSSKWLDSNIDPKLLFDNNPKDFPNQNKNLQLQGPSQQPPQPAPAPAPVLNTDGGAAGLGSKVTNQLQGVKAAVGPALAGIADGSDKVWDKLVEATKAAGAAIVSQVQAWVGQIQGALAGLGPAGEAAGQALSTGMAAGIAAGASSAIAAAHALAQGVEAAAKTTLQINSPSKVFHGIGLGVGEGLGDGIDAGTGSVIDKAKGVAQQLQDAMTGGGKLSKGLKDSVKQSMDELTIQSQQLKVQEDQLPRGDKAGRAAIQAQRDQISNLKEDLSSKSKELGYNSKYGANSPQSHIQEQMEAIDAQKRKLEAQLHGTKDKGERQKLQAQIDDLRTQKDELNLQKDQLGTSGKKDKTDEITKSLGQSVNKMVDIGKNFAMANVNQFESDIGISGKGAIPTIANIGLDWATSTLGNLASGLIGGPTNMKGTGNTHIHVNSIDEGLAAKQTLENRQALTNNAGR